MLEIQPHHAELLTRWTVRFAVACYLGRVAIDLGLLHQIQSSPREKIARWIWTVGCIFYLLHVACAFAFVHQWSHQRAVVHTTEQTQAVTGVRSGIGIYFNYVFTLFWVADTVAWWVVASRSILRRRSYYCTVQTVFAFMMVNATVVFGPPVWRFVAVGVGIGFAIIYVRAWHRHASSS